jgi:BlaI family transcriptional regulator, penicillinase repressor
LPNAIRIFTDTLTIVLDSATVSIAVQIIKKPAARPTAAAANHEARPMNSVEKDLSKAEWKVMKIVWQLQKAMAREVYTIAGEQYSWRPATVKTILKRLVDKGYVSTTQVGNGFVYRPDQSALATLQSAADTLLTNAIEGATGPLLAHMVQQVSLSADDLDSLQRLIDEKKLSLKKSGHKKSAKRSDGRAV